jgi:hypothetical protein
MAQLKDLIARAAEDAAFRDRFAADPLGVASTEGVHGDSTVLKEKLGIPGATDQELAEVLKARVGDAVQGYSARGCAPCFA